MCACEQARELNYIDKKCPFTGQVSIRGRILSGIVKSLKMQRFVGARTRFPTLFMLCPVPLVGVCPSGRITFARPAAGCQTSGLLRAGRCEKCQRAETAPDSHTCRAGMRTDYRTSIALRASLSAYDMARSEMCPTSRLPCRLTILTPTSALLARRTLTIRRDYLHYIKKYNRFEKRHRNLSAHVSPAFRDIKLGDQVHVGQCRPLSKVGSPLVRTLASMAQICLPSPRMQKDPAWARKRRSLTGSTEPILGTAVNPATRPCLLRGVHSMYSFSSYPPI